MRQLRIRRAAAVIRRGGVVVYPTDTLYGLGASALDPGAVERAFEVKERPLDRPVSVAVVLRDLGRVARLDVHRGAVDRLLPGPVTLLLPAAPDLPSPLVRDGKVGVRVPDDPVARALLDAVGPITATSANLSGEPPEPEPRHSTVARRADLVLRDGPRSGSPSTVYDAVTGEVVREGALTGEEVRRRVAPAQDP